MLILELDHLEIPYQTYVEHIFDIRKNVEL